MNTLTKLVIAGMIVGLSGGAALAQYPDRPVTLVVPFPPGGGSDVAARALAQQLSIEWGQPVVVENRAGAAGAVGATYVANAEPDGYTIMLGNFGTQAINPLLHDSLTYDPHTDFENITLVAELPLVLIARTDLDVETPQDLIDYAAANPGAVTYSTSGPGSSMHLAAELFAYEAGVELFHIAYSGGAPAVNDVVGGHIDVSFSTVLETSNLVREGVVKGLGLTSAQPIESLPEIAPIAETTLPGYSSVSWLGLVAPAGTPAEIVEKIAADAQAALATEDLSERLLAQGAIPIGSTPEEYSAFVAEEVERYGRLIEEAGITAD